VDRGCDEQPRRPLEEIPKGCRELPLHGGTVPVEFIGKLLIAAFMIG
jgi:hypothetical protein